MKKRFFLQKIKYSLFGLLYFTKIHYFAEKRVLHAYFIRKYLR